MKLFDQKTTATIVIDVSSEEAIYIAARDLQRNLRCLSGKTGGFDIVSYTELDAPKISIKTVSDGRIEAYTVRVENNCVEIVGSDTLGTVFGIYAFATRCLGIVPVYRLVDLFPKTRVSLKIDEQTFCSESRFIRFRGWFLNDEDLLSFFKGGGGYRNVEFKFYNNVMRVDVLDMILETALRLEINMIIPSSFVDIVNPADKALVDAVVRRGMYITHHHVEPMGVSFFAADNYIKKYGNEGEEVSFISNRCRMEEIWRYYAQKWSEYGDRVIWQLGLRGKADAAVWKNDPNVPDSFEARGTIISDAIKTQYNILCETFGHDDFYSTITLWAEGAELYGRGHISVPKRTIVIFSDVGFSQMFGDDFFKTERAEGTIYGIYYHVAYMREGPHLSEGCDPYKMAFSYKQALEKNTLFYSMVNVSNVRPVHFSAWYNAELMRHPENFDAKKSLLRISKSLFHEWGDRIDALRDEYYRTIVDFGEEELKIRCTRFDFYYHNHGELSFPLFPGTDGTLRCTGRFLLLDNLGGWGRDGSFIPALEASLSKWQNLYQKMQETEEELPEHYKLYFAQFLKFQTLYMMQLTSWRLAVRVIMNSNDPKMAQEAYITAIGALNSILEERKILEVGNWDTWHKGELKIDIAELLYLTKDKYKNKWQFN